MSFYWLTCRLAETSHLRNVELVLCNAQEHLWINAIIFLICWRLLDLILNYWCKPCILIWHRMRNKTRSDLLMQFLRAGLILMVDALAQLTRWRRRGRRRRRARGSLSLLCHLPSLFSSASRGGEGKGQRQLTSTRPRGKSDGKQEVERQTMEWRASVKRWREQERQRERGRSKEQALEC